MKQWRWSLIDPVSGKQESGQQWELQAAMKDVANTVEHLIDVGYEGEVEDNGRRTSGI